MTRSDDLINLINYYIIIIIYNIGDDFIMNKNDLQKNALLHFYKNITKLIINESYYSRFLDKFVVDSDLLIQYIHKFISEYKKIK